MEPNRTDVRIPVELLKKVDAAGEVTESNRSEIVATALQEYLDAIANDEAFRTAVVELYLDDEIEFSTLKEFVGQPDAEAVRTSKSLVDDGEVLARDLTDR